MAKTPATAAPDSDVIKQPPAAGAAAAKSTAPTHARIYSSLPLQIFIYLNERYLAAMWLVLLLLLVYKSYAFPYAGAALPLEISGLFVFAGLEVTRLFMGSCTRGNKMEERSTLGIFLGLTMVTVFVHLFYCIWQTYV
ncbi:Transmembrane protein 80 [Entophlyctis sp. JEL0112]|nr:Transmembrane protein 80 [Entophlyctis sp. JEL0112]